MVWYHSCLDKPGDSLYSWRQDAGLDRLVNWYSAILPYGPPLTFFFWARFVSVLFILAFYLLSYRDCWFWPADRWDCDTDVLHLGNYDSPWNCLLDSYLAGDPAGHFTAQLPFPALLLVTLQLLLLLLLLLEQCHSGSKSLVCKM